MPELTLEEVERDNHSSERDLRALRMVVNGLTVFITQPSEEDRRALRVDLLKYEALLAECCRLDGLIKEKLFELRAKKKSLPSSEGETITRSTVQDEE